MAGDLLRIQIEETPRYENAPSTAPYRVSTDALDLPIQTGRIVPEPQMIDRSDELRNIEGGVFQVVETYEPAGSLAFRCYINSLAWLLTINGWQYTVSQGTGTNEEQTLTITGNPTGGTFTITIPADFAGVGNPAAPIVTGPIPYNATAAQVQAALVATGFFRSDVFGATVVSEVVCAGGPLPGSPVTISFRGRYAATSVALLTTTDSLTGGTSPASAIAQTTAGAPGTVLDPDGNGITAGAYRWVFTKRGGITAKSAQILAIYEDEGMFVKGQGFGVSQLQLNEMGDLSADLVGIVAGRLGSNPGLTGSFDSASIIHARRGDLLLDWLDGSGEASAFSLQIANPLERIRTMSIDPPSHFPDKLEHGDERVRVTGSIPMRIASPVDWDALVNAQTFQAKARWRLANQIAGSGTRYGLWFELPAAQYTGGGPEELANRRRHGATFDFWASWDEALGYDCRITLVCAVDAVETYA